MLEILSLFTIFFGLSIVLFRRFWIHYLASSKPVFLKSFEAVWDRESNILPRALQINLFEINDGAAVNFLFLRRKNELILWVSKEYLKTLNESPNIMILDLIEKKPYDFSNMIFQVFWIFFQIKENIFKLISSIDKKIVSQIFIFVFLPLDTILNNFWSRFSNRKEFNEIEWVNKKELWLEFVE